MPSLPLEIPVWVQRKKNHFVVQSLFAPTFQASDERYENALRKLTQAIRAAFASYKVRRENLDPLLWLLFSPDYRFETIAFEFKYGQRFFNDALSVVWFRQGNYTVVRLPGLEHHQFITRQPDPRRADLLEEVTQQVQVFGRNYRKQTDEEFILDPHAAAKGEFCTTLDLNLLVPGDAILTDPDELFRQFFRPNVPFEGQREITRVGQDLNELYPGELGRAWYCDEAVEQVKRLVYNRENVPVALVGKRKVGKTAVLHEVICRHLEEHAGRQLAHLDTVWQLDPSRIIAGMSIVGAWQRRLEAILQFAMHPLERHPRQDKLYFTNVVALFRIGKSSQNSMTLSDVLKPYLQDRRVQIILEATPEEWDVVSELGRGFTDLFKVIRLREPETETALRIIGNVRSQLEHRHRFAIGNGALVRLVELQQRFRADGMLVGAVAESLRQLATRYANQEVDTQRIVDEFSSQTHLNPRLTNDDLRVGRPEFGDYLAQRLIGQPAATACLADLLHVIKAQLQPPGRPLGSFLFIGPTGVGKTQAAKILADYLFTHEERLVRFDMNEFIDESAINRLVGDFANPDGQLTAKIRYNPFCTLLFDEIEKAHPDVHNLLLQVLDEGRLTDALGRTVSFCNTVIVMTSNLGADRVGREINIQQREEVATRTYEKAVRDFFRPEFINRLDKIVFFQKLTAQHIGQIAGLQIQALLKRHGFLRRHTILNVSPEVLESIAEKGYDPQMGGRALKRQIEKELTGLVAEQLVALAPESPVIFNLSLRNGHLVPHLTPLQPVAANATPGLPGLHDPEITFERFARLLEDTEDLKEEMLAIEEENGGFVYSTEKKQETSDLLRMRERLRPVEERLRRILWEYQAGKKVNIAKTAVPLKSVSGVKVVRNADGHSDKSFFQQLFTQLEITDFFNEVYTAAARVLNEHNALYFNLFQQIAWLDYEFAHYLRASSDRAVVCLASCVAPGGTREVAYLKQLYARLFLVEEELSLQPGCVWLRLKGPGVGQLMRQEVGFHTFFAAHAALLPVAVTLHPAEADTNLATLAAAAHPADASARVIRVYALGEEDLPKRLITDLRTGLVHNRDLTTNELQWLFYASTISQETS